MMLLHLRPLLYLALCASTGFVCFYLVMAEAKPTTQARASGNLRAAPLRFAVIGDYGDAGKDEEAVANLVKGWNPDFIVTVGDNNYPDGAANTIDQNIGQYYHDYIAPYTGTYGPGSPSGNRFFPILGNRDWNGIKCTGSTCPGPYFDYFVLPGNERYYDFIKEPIHFFMLDSDPEEPDGITVSSTQANWLQRGLAASTSPWQLVLLHHSPYSSGENHGSIAEVQWPYKAWGADAVLSGHDHHYERVLVDGLVYLINGIGGRNLNGVKTPVPGSQKIHTASFGAMLVEADAQTIVFKLFDLSFAEIDSYTLTQSTPPPPGDERQFLPLIKHN